MAEVSATGAWRRRHRANPGGVRSAPAARASRRTAAARARLAAAGARTRAKRAASKAAERYANEEALEHTRRGLEHVGADDTETHWQLLDRQRTLFDQLGRYDDAQTTLDALLSLAQRDGNPQRLGRLAMQRALLADRRGDFDKARALAREAASLAERVEDFETAAMAHAECAFASTLLGDYPLARVSVEIATAIGDRYARSIALISLAQALTETGNPGAAAAAAREAIEEAAAGGNQNGEPALVALSALARATLDLGDVDGAIQHVERLLGLIAPSRDSIAKGPEILFTCYQVLAAARDERAARTLASAHAALLALAGEVSPASRERYLNGAPEHRRILAEWARKGERSGTLPSMEIQR